MWIYIFTDECVRFTITDFAPIKDADFDNVYHLLSWNQKKPASEETGQ